MVPNLLNSRRPIGLAFAASIAVVAASIFAGSSAKASTIASWDFTTNGSGFANGTTAGTTASGVTSAVITRNGGVVVNTASYSFDSSGFVANSTAANVQVGFNTSTAYNVTDLKFSAFSSNSGPGAVDVYASVNGGAATFVQTLTVTTTSGTSATNYDITLNDTVNTSLQVYFSAHGTTSANGGTLSSSGTFRLNNPGDLSSTPFAFIGTAQSSPVPAPPAVPAALAGMLASGGLALVKRGRRIA